jgi:hypothetical protein
MNGYHFFDPRMSISAATALNPSDPFSVPFVLSNDGNVSIHCVSYIWIFNSVESEKGTIFDHVEIRDSRYIRARLYPSEKDTFRCLFARNFASLRLYLPIKYADMILRVLYRPSFRFSQQSKYFRFVMQRSTDNQLYWFPQSLVFSEVSK